MATGLPRYQTMGVQYADLPQVSVAPQRAAVSGLSQVEQALNQMTAYFQEQAVTEAKEAGMRYAAENPVTKEQVDAALGDPQALKIKGAGRIFQQTYQSTQAALLSNELLTEGKKQIAKMSAAIEAGGPVNLEAIEATLKDMSDGYASTIMALDPAQSVKLRASLATIGSALYMKAGEKAVERIKAQKSISFDDSLKADRAMIRDLLRMGLPAQELQKRLEILKQGYQDLSLFPDNKYLKEFDDVAQKEKIAFLVERGTSPEAGRESQAIRRAQKGDFGDASGIYASMDTDDQKKVQDGITARFQAISAAESREYTNDSRAADRILTGIYALTDIGQIDQEIKKLDEMAAPPSVVKNARDYKEALLTDGPKNDNLETFATLSRKAAASELTSAEVITARKNGRITNATAKAFLKDINNPSEAVAEGTRIFRRQSMITAENLPPEIDDKDGRAAASRAFAEADAALRIFASTPDPQTGAFPTEPEIKAKRIELSKDIDRAMLPVVRTQQEATLKTITTLIPDKYRKDAANNVMKIEDVVADPALYSRVIAAMKAGKVVPGQLAVIDAARQRYLRYQSIITEAAGR